LNIRSIKPINYQKFTLSNEISNISSYLIDVMLKNKVIESKSQEGNLIIEF